MLRKILGGAILATALSASAAQAAQPLRVPFECKEKITGRSFSGHDPANSIDFNKGNGNEDRGMKVLAAGAGRVVQVYSHPSGGYGKTVLIDHGAGRSTFYAHLLDWTVKAKQVVEQGQLIGHLGRSSARDGRKPDFYAHLHYEERLNGRTVEARFGGKRATPYSHQGAYWPMTSDNCGNAAVPSAEPAPVPAPAPTPSGEPAPAAGVPLPANPRPFAATVRTDNGLPVIARLTPRTNGQELARFKAGDKVKVYCQTTGQKVSGKFGTSTLWDLVRLPDGRGAYVTDTYVFTGSDGRVAPNC